MIHRVKSAYRKAQLLLLAMSFLVAVAGHLYMRGQISGYDMASNECYGISCEEYTLIIGQSNKEARQAKKQEVASIWSALQ